jgi:hypothetical protein
MKAFLALPREMRVTMGIRGREKMEREFDEQRVIRRYLETLARVKPTSSNI